jgi:hypothetical protein
MEIFIKSKEAGPGMMTHNYNPSYLGGWDSKIVIWGQPREKFSETLSQ